MRFQDFVLPGLALGAAVLLIGPPEESLGFSKIGGSLGLNQRDVRLFNNFADAQSNNNVAIDPNWPGWDGAELAIWKGAGEWASLPHGDGTGDPSQPAVGSGGANFDAAWMGSAASVGNTNHNIVSALGSGGACGGGVLAFTETPISDGWRIRFCDSWVWADGPSGILSSQFDIQGVMCHEYGHALGLGHSSVGSATMFPSTSQGAIGPRSIAADDIAGIQCIYGVAAGTKPSITATQGLGTTVNIFGTGFDSTNNEVWFTNGTVTAVSVDPRVVVTGLPATGNVITVNIPIDASAGDVFVRIPGLAIGENLSNGYPWDRNSTFGNPGGLSFPNTVLPAELGSDPTLADTGGDTGIGPKINDPTEPFALSLDCTGASGSGIYTITLRMGHLTTPLGSSFGDLWGTGPTLLKASGLHSQNVVSWGPTTLPNDSSFVGIEYTAQGYCSQSGGGRLSNGLVQTIGSP